MKPKPDRKSAERVHALANRLQEAIAPVADGQLQQHVVYASLILAARITAPAMVGDYSRPLRTGLLASQRELPVSDRHRGSIRRPTPEVLRLRRQLGCRSRRTQCSGPCPGRERPGLRYRDFVRDQPNVTAADMTAVFGRMLEQFNEDTAAFQKRKGNA